MRREHRDPNTFTPSTIKQVKEGGTGTSNLDNFITSLNVVIDDITDPNGPVIADNNGNIPSDVIPSNVGNTPSIIGPSSLYTSQVGTYTISNFDSDASYNITVMSGTVSRTGKTITYTAPSTPGVGGFIIDGRPFNVSIENTGVATPSITSPLTNTTNHDSSITFISSDFTMISQSDTHEVSDWELATDSQFTNIIKQSVNSSVNKLSWTVSELSPNTVYYCRMRHKGTVFGYSGWSPSVKLTTKANFTPSLEIKKLLATDGQAGDYFGWSVAISGDGNTAIIGARGDGNATDAGSAYIFVRSGTNWSYQAKLLASDGQSGDYFGRSVALSSDGNTAIIGAYLDDDKATDAGAAYIYVRSGTNWTYQTKLLASDGQASDYFGYSVAISGDGNTAIIGAYGDDDKATNAGAAYIFTRSNTDWIQQTKLLASNGQGGDYFGYSVAISRDGDTAIIGAYGDDDKAIDAGSAYIFVRSGTNWSYQTKLLASDGQANDYFGYSVAISGDGNTAIIGAYADDDKGTDAGSAYIFA